MMLTSVCRQSMRVVAHPKPEDMANAALFMASDESEFMSGAVLVIDAGKETLSDRAQKFYPIEA